ncbi:HlyD family efflux transporter periplasmic adaptor subunit [Phormidium tenue FACHB-886]|nr:HlyD family efflux transporter periplasmic adaptor subunit [Phormidium tenue FACHB-886]
MPNPSHLKQQFHQNGHRSNSHLTEEASNLNKPAKTSSSAEPELLDSVTNEWSSLTKELVDTLPRVWTRSLLYLLIVFAGIVLPWASLAKVDETGTARGRLEPKGKTVRLDAPVAGTVAKIEVKEGELVKAGQSLLELESELARTDLQQAQAKLEGQLNRSVQLDQIRNQLEIATRMQQLQSQAQVSEQVAQIDQIQQRLNSSQRAHAFAEEFLARDLSEVHRYQRLQQEGVVAEVKVVETRRAASENQRLLEQAQSEMEQAQSELKKQQIAYDRIVRTGELTVLESKRQLEDLQAQSIDLQAEIAQTKNQIQSLQFQLQQRSVRAPISGTIFQLPIQRAGAVVQPGQMIAQVAPQGTSLILRAQMSPQESGFLRQGMPVKVKFDAYPFQDYGVVEGHLSWVSPDSKITETENGSIETFELEITLDKPYIQVVNKRISLTSGQTATAEVIIRQRRVIDFIIDPFKKLQQGGLDL